MKIWGKFYVQFLQKSSFKFQIFHYIETGIQHIEVKQNFEPAFLKYHSRKSLKFFTVVLIDQVFLILIQKPMLYLWSNYLTVPLSHTEYWNRPIIFYFMPWFLLVDRTWESCFCTVCEGLAFNIIVYDITKIRVY